MADSLAKYRKKIDRLSVELSKYDHLSVVEAAFHSLLGDVSGEHRGMLRLPWLQLFLLKRALIGDSGHRHMSKAKFSELANQLYRIQHIAADLNHPDFELALRPMLLQQVWYQQSDTHHIVNLLRQRCILIDGVGWYDNTFKKLAGLSLSSFYTVSMYLIMLMHQHKKSAFAVGLPLLIYRLCPVVSPSDICAYFRLVGIRSDELSTHFKLHALADTPVGEYFQDTPLRFKPVLINGQDLVVWDISLFKASISMLVPALLKKHVGGYKDHFGPAFEQYLGRLLRSSQLEMWSSEDVRDFYRNNSFSGLNADYIIFEEENVIVIESKAIEPSDIVKTTVDAALLRKNLSESFIKAIHQGVRTANLMASKPEYAGRKFYSLAVTHDDFGIFDGRWIADHVDSSLELAIQASYPGNVLLLERVFYCTISDLEDLVRGQVSGQLSISEHLEKASRDQRKRASSKWAFHQTLLNVFSKPCKHHDELNKQVEGYMSEMPDQINKCSRFWAKRVPRFVRLTSAITDHLVSSPFVPIKKIP